MVACASIESLKRKNFKPPTRGKPMNTYAQPTNQIIAPALTGGYSRPTYTNGRKTVPALTLDMLRQRAPSVFAEKAYSNTSDRYTFIPTFRIVERLIQEGFFPVAAMQSSSRIEEKKGFTKHLVKFRKHDVSEVGGLIPELIVGNSHDLSGQFYLSFGMLRLVCMNGLMVADSSFDTIKVRHTGDIVEQVIEGSYQVIENVPKVIERVDQFKQIGLTTAEQNVFAEAALMLRYDKGEAPIEASKLTAAQRYEDQKSDLWTTYNKVQENLIKGGVRGKNKSGGRTSTRSINAVSENVRVNKALWELTEQMARIKNGDTLQAA